MTEDLDDFLNYLQKAGLNTIDWRLCNNLNKLVDKTMGFESQKLVDKTIQLEIGQKLSIGKLVRHRTVPQLGLGLVVGESDKHKGYWIVQWCDPRYHDVGQLGIDREFLEIV